MKNTTKKFIMISILSMILFIHIQAIHAQDWPQWRGPNRNGVLPNHLIAGSNPEGLSKVWQISIGSGYSSPVVGGNKIFLHTREAEDEIVAAYHLVSGKQVWRDQYPAPFKQNPYATKHGKGPNSTPLVHENRLYTYGMSEVLSCYDPINGDLIWRRDFSKGLDTSRLFCGAAMSPLIENNKLIVHIGDDRGGALVAIDINTGKAIWQWEGDGPGYASPLIAELEGVQQVITMTDGAAVGIDFQTGKLLWQLPFADEWNENIVSPTQFQDFIILSGVRQGTMAIKPIKSSEGWETKKVWHNNELPMYLSSPILENDKLFGFSTKRKGQYFCLNAKTGETLWTSEGRQGRSASLLLAGELLILLNLEGELTFAKKDFETFEPLQEFVVADQPTYAHPVLLENQILVKDNASLTLWRFE